MHPHPSDLKKKFDNEAEWPRFKQLLDAFYAWNITEAEFVAACIFRNSLTIFLDVNMTIDFYVTMR